MQACRLRAACPTIVRADVGASDWATLHRPTGATTSETITGGGSLHCRAAWTGSTGRQCHIDIYQLTRSVTPIAADTFYVYIVMIDAETAGQRFQYRYICREWRGSVDISPAK